MGTSIVFLPVRKIELDQPLRVTDRKQVLLLWVRRWKVLSVKIWGPGVSPQVDCHTQLGDLIGP